jgi:hypothetical protein
MRLLYCLVERRNNIDPEWQLIAGIICTEVREAEEFLQSYKESRFDIYEYRVVPCARDVFDKRPFMLRLKSPTTKGKV